MLNELCLKNSRGGVLNRTLGGGVPLDLHKPAPFRSKLEMALF